MSGILVTKHVLNAVFRISDVRIGRTELEAALNVTLDRYEPERRGSGHYAQIDIPDAEDVWDEIVACVQKIGEPLSTLRQKEFIGAISMDVAIAFRESLATLTVTAPSNAAAIIGRYGIDIQFSVHLTSEGADAAY